MDNIYEQLAMLPLFSGVTKESMNRIIGSTKFHFLKYQTGDSLVKPGDLCTHIKWIISGSVRVSIADKDNGFTVSHSLPKLSVIAPEYVFGRHTVYPCKVVALEPVGILQIEKAEYLKILNTDPIFLINYLNMLSLIAQHSVEGTIATLSGGVEERIAFSIVSLTRPGSYDITLSTRNKGLGSLFGIEPKYMVEVLEKMKLQGLIEYSNNEILFLNRRGLVDKIHNMIH